MADLFQIVKPDTCTHEDVICNEEFENDPRSSVRRSYSDSELPTLVAALQTEDAPIEGAPSQVASSPTVEPRHGTSENYSEKLVSYASLLPSG